MTTPRRTLRRPLAPLAAPREPVDPARIGRRVVRRRAKGMDAGAVAQALEDARFDARQDSRHEHLADDERGQAELAEWERIGQLLAVAAPNAVYDPDADDVVQAELAAEAAAAAWEAELRETARVAARADELQALRELGTLEQTEPREGDEAARDELTQRAGSYVQKDIDAWLAHALAAHLGHYRDPAAREAAADLLPTHHINQLTAGRQLTGLRQVLDCPATPTTLRQGPAAVPAAPPDWLALLCPAHSEALPGWPGTAADTDGLRLDCGSVLDYRSAEQLLQSHADLWLTPLTGVDPKTYGGVWPDVLDQADRVMRARLGEDTADGDETLHSLAMMLGMASRNAAEGNLYQATVPLAYCETLAQRL